MIAMKFFYMKHDFYAGQFTKTAFPLFEGFNERVALWFATWFNKSSEIYKNLLVRHFEQTFYETIICVPFINGKVATDFIEERMRELEEERMRELEEERMRELEAWLRAAGFEDYNLTEGEQIALKEIDKLEYQIFNVEELFGKSTRGKRLKSADRVTGSLPFVTAGETDEGISAFIGNCVTIFPANTTTIDMFGSAKYRNYEYGADDHIAVVHTQKLQEDAAIFVTSAIHKSSHNGQFDYGKNFYAKDADELNILLPTKGVVPDYSKMATIISAVKKLVIKDVAEYANKKIRVAQQVIAK